MKALILVISGLILTSCTFAQSQNDSVPNELVGKWYKGSTSALGFLDRRTGISDAAGGDGFSFEFKSNGTFVKAGMVKAGSYSCSTIVFGYETGKFTATGNNLKMADKENYVSYKDSCNPHTNSEKNAKLAIKEYPYEIRDDEDGDTVLCLAYKGGEECFKKAEA